MRDVTRAGYEGCNPGRLRRGTVPGQIEKRDSTRAGCYEGCNPADCYEGCNPGRLGRGYIPGQTRRKLYTHLEYPPSRTVCLPVSLPPCTRPSTVLTTQLLQRCNDSYSPLLNPRSVLNLSFEESHLASKSPEKELKPPFCTTNSVSRV